jgi:hypothetical protein
MDLSPLGQAALTVIIGVTVFVFGQIVVKFFIDPLDQLSQMKGQVLDSLVYYANVYTKPFADDESTEFHDLRKKAYEDLRQKATLLMSKATLVRLYSFASSFGIVPRRDNVNKAHSDLIYLSNACISRDLTGDINTEASRLSEEVVRLLTSDC